MSHPEKRHHHRQQHGFTPDSWFDVVLDIRRSCPGAMKCFLAIVLTTLASTSAAEETMSVMCDGSGGGNRAGPEVAVE